MFGQWALGTSPIGEPEEIVTTTPAPADATVWFTVATLTDVVIEASNTQMDIEQ